MQPNKAKSKARNKARNKSSRGNVVLIANRVREPAMPAFTVKNIPDALYADLKVAAQLNHRSINSEVIVCLEKALKPNKVSSDERLQRIRALRFDMPSFNISADEITQAINIGRP